MKIIKAVVLRIGGPDIVVLETDLPSPTPAISSQPLSLRFDAAAGTGVFYVAENFGVPVEVIETPRNPSNFSRKT